MGDMIAIHQQAGTINAYLTIPEKRSTFRGAVIVVHELWGLNSQIKAVSDRIAALGFYVLAPDLYSGKTANRQMSDELQSALFSTNERVRYAAQPKLRALLAPTQTPQFTALSLSRLASSFEYMYNQPLVHQKVLLVGFGLGGDYAFEMAMREPRLRGVVSFYGRAPRITAELRHISCPILSLYGQKDHALVRSLDAMAPHMRQAGVDFSAVVYGEAGHGFFNDLNPFAYRPSDANDAWRRVASFLHDNSA